MGNKILRQRLKGPMMAAYYPERLPDLRDLAREFKHLNLEVDLDDEEDRLEHVEGWVL